MEALEGRASQRLISAYLPQIQEGGLKSLAAMVRQLDKLEPQSKAMVQELITGLFGSWLELLPLPELDKKRFLP